MKIFVSWSGELSKAVAVSLRKYVPLILQGLDCFMSKHDIESGSRWTDELKEQLDQSNFGILCITHESLSSSWLLFEAGSLVKHSQGRACGLLIGDIIPTDITGPLAQFQHRKFERKEIFQLFKDLNNEQEKPLTPEDLSSLFEKFWPDIESNYRVALEAPSPAPKRRSERNILEEILTRLREVEVEQRRSDGQRGGTESKLLKRPVSIDSIAWYSLWKFPEKPVSEKIQALLWRDLDELRYQTIGDIDQAVNCARAPVAAYEAECPRLFKFSTDQITKSIGFVDLDFRSRHGFSKRTLEAFKRYENLVDPLC